jgi:hypothetical protein
VPIGPGSRALSPFRSVGPLPAISRTAGLGLLAPAAGWRYVAYTVRPPAWKLTGWSTQAVLGVAELAVVAAELAGAELAGAELAGAELARAEWDVVVVPAWPQADISPKPARARTPARRKGEGAMTGSDSGGAVDRG